MAGWAPSFRRPLPVGFSFTFRKSRMKAPMEFNTQHIQIFNHRLDARDRGRGRGE